MIRHHLPATTTLVAVGLSTIAAVIALLSWSQLAPVSDPAVLCVLLACAVLAEFFPISLERYALRVSVGLPFLAGIFVLSGGIVATASALFIGAVSSIGLAIVSRQKLQGLWFFLNIGIGVIACALASLVPILVAKIQPTVPLPAWERALDFSLIHCLVNVCAVAVLRGKLIGHRSTREDRGALALLIGVLALYLSASVGLSILVTSDAPWLFLAMVLPILVLRVAVRERLSMLEHYYETVVALMIMLQRAHPYTHGHLERVARLAERVAIRLGLSALRARQVRDAAILHDVGKIAIDEEILDKPSKLTEAEFAHVKHHAAFGANILEPCDHFRDIVPWIRYHHERPDGKGYPEGLPDEKIPIESKIIAVVDAFDAMVGGAAPGTKRGYREPMDVREALNELDRCSDTQFDRAVVVAFREVLLEGGV